MPADNQQLHFLCHRQDLVSGAMRSFQIGRIRVVLCRNADSFFVLRDICPHQGAALSLGALGGTIVASPVGEYCYGRAGQIVRCPRHGHEYDLETGRALHDPDHVRVKAYMVVERGDDILVALPTRGRRTASLRAVPAD